MTGGMLNMKNHIIFGVLFTILIGIGLGLAEDVGRPDIRNDATEYTIAANLKANNTSAWNNNEEDFRFSNRGFIATDDPLIIPSDYPNMTSWSMEEFAYQDNETAPNTINPLLYRHARLNKINGLFEVVPDKIYQVRGYDITAMSLIKGDTGGIVIDPMLTVETARAAMRLVNRTLGNYPVKAVIYSHPHADHYQGVKGVITEEEVDAGEIQIIAPVGFMEHAISENVYAGTAMQRRATYMYGTALPHDEKGLVDNGLGKYTPFGRASLIAPTVDIGETGQNLTIDGVRMEFQYNTNTEAPVEINIWFPDYKALFMAENCVGTLHNILTLRGAQVRDPLEWSRFLDEARRLYGDKAEVVFTAHNWPRFGSDKVVELLENQRDMYKYINDQTLNLMNKGYTMDEIANMIVLPESLQEYWYTHGFYGQIYMGVKATYQRYLGFYDANPINLKRLPPEEFAQNITRYMGGADAVLPKLAKDYDAGQYELVASIANYLVFADPTNMEARRLEAAALEQLGYQAESGPARDAYLMGAQELRSTEPVQGITMISADVMSGMPLDQLLDYIAVRLNASEAAGEDFKMNLVIDNTSDRALIQVKNSVLNYWLKESSQGANVSIHMPRKAIEQLALNPSVPPAEVTTTGDSQVFERFIGMLDMFKPNFNIILP
jgi:alkyl sulfatase BDS1-like metallo-beta-lactamase superfamily hydrolase